MIELSFASSVRACLRAAKTLVVVGPASALAERAFPAKLLERRVRDAVVRLAKATSPGDQGATATTLGAGAHDAIVLGVLPDKVSRYNSPARAECIRRVVESAAGGRRGKVAVVLVLDRADHTLAAVNAVARALPRFFRREQAPRARFEVVCVARDGTFLPVDSTIATTAETSRIAAELVDTPPSELHPEALAERARALLAPLGVRLREIVGPDLLAAGLRGIYEVGKAATVAPRMLVATHGKGGPHVALVGKGICFDTGGLHLKARGFMEGMKADMGGAAAVLGAFRVLVESGWKGRVSLVLCIAENAIGPGAYKPDDILTLHSGKTVEINNTDAEGRLLLADGVSWAARELGAEVIIDAATLTGAQLIATGLVHAAIISNDESTEQVFVDAGRRSGDLVHPLPFAPELYKQEFASKLADMRNSVGNRNNAQSACAAQFVWWHLFDAPAARSLRWCHIDLAGPAFPRDRGTGFGVALIAEAVRRLAADST